MDTRTPIIIIPGVMGSRLNRASDGVEVWPRVNSINGMVISLSDDYLNELKLLSSGSQVFGREMNASSIIDKETVGPIDTPLTTR